MSGRLRCWPGALAVIVRADNPRNLGKTVRCIRLVEPRDELMLRTFRDFRAGPVWEVDPLLIHDDGNVSGLIGDHKLTPILPPPGTESTKTDADKPVEVA